MTAAELYERDPEFRALMAAWVADRACPISLGDFLEERGCSELCCRIARWAGECQERPVYSPCREWGERDTPCGVFPTMGADSSWFLSWVRADFHSEGGLSSSKTAEEIPADLCDIRDPSDDPGRSNSGYRIAYRPTPLKYLLMLLDAPPPGTHDPKPSPKTEAAPRRTLR